jgi:hypothetical protein
MSAWRMSGEAEQAAMRGKAARALRNKKGPPRTSRFKTWPLETTAKDLSEIFSKFGPLANVKIGQDNGTAYIEMPDEIAGQRALAELHRTELGGRMLMLYEVGERAAGFYFTPGFSNQ